ncbi:hypothetical protein [uncultured Enterovirga sp.]|uniref:hypothetical protein n=1 Tax=uncultured Enterovirga sp. TaxID=2026352 RepID=UPI0035CAB530
MHLVLPGWTERAVAATGLAQNAASILYVHASPDAVPASGPPPRPGPRILDAVALGETALVAAKRDPDGRPSLDLSAAADPGGGVPAARRNG